MALIFKDCLKSCGFNPRAATDKLAAVHLVCEDLRTELAQCKADAAAAEETRAAGEGQRTTAAANAAREAEAAAAQERLAAALALRNQQHSATLAALRDGHAAAMAQRDEQQSAALTAAAAAMQGRHTAQLAQERQEFSATLKNTQEKLCRSETSAAQLRDDLIDTQHELAQSRADNTLLGRQVQELYTQGQSAVLNVLTLQQEVKLWRGRAEEAAKAAADAQTKVRELQSYIAELDKVVVAAEKRSATMLSENQGLLRELFDMQQHYEATLSAQSPPNSSSSSRNRSTSNTSSNSSGNNSSSNSSSPTAQLSSNSSSSSMATAGNAYSIEAYGGGRNTATPSPVNSRGYRHSSHTRQQRTEGAHGQQRKMHSKPSANAYKHASW